jgi:hypothetical protein
MSIIHGAQAGQGGPVTIACINKATVDLGVPLDKLTATLQKCFDEYFLPVWGYPVKLYTPDAPKPTRIGNSFTSMTPIRPARSATMT